VNLSAFLFYLAEKSIITRPIVNALFISNYQESKEYFLGKISIFIVFILLVFLISTYFIFSKKRSVPRKMSLSLLLLFFFSFGLSFISGPVGFLTSEFVQYQYFKASLKKQVETRSKNLDKSFEIIENDGASKVLVIIGESLNRNYMSLYGYDANTSPNLLTLASDSLNGKLIYFTDAISAD